MSRFSKVSEQYSPKARSVRFALPLEAAPGAPQPTLLVRYAGDTNNGWRNAIAKFNAKTGLARKAVQGRSREADRLALERDIELYPEHIISGWEGIVDDDGQQVSFSREACREFLEALPQWIFDDVRIFCSTATNFIAGSEPTEEEIGEQAGN